MLLFGFPVAFVSFSEYRRFPGPHRRLLHRRCFWELECEHGLRHSAVASILQPKTVQYLDKTHYMIIACIWILIYQYLSLPTPFQVSKMNWKAKVVVLENDAGVSKYDKGRSSADSREKKVYNQPSSPTCEATRTKHETRWYDYGILV